MSSYFENGHPFNTGSAFFKNQVLKSYKTTVCQFVKITKNVSLFKFFFFSLFLLEFFLSLFLSLNFPRSSIIAIVLGVIVLSVFTYFVLLFYFEAKKPEQIDDLCSSFISSCRHAIAIPQGTAEHHLSVANALVKLSYYLNGIEFSYFSSEIKWDFLKTILEKLSSFLHEEDIFKMQERLLFSAIEEHISQIKNTPIDLELHVSLANGYVALAKLYLDYQTKISFSRFAKKNKSLFSKRFEIASKRAIEEFIILKDFAPNDPWIHAQLAQCYHSLNLFEEEAKEYQIMLDLSPDDNEIKFRLGRIYFNLGRNAEGLQVYDELKKEGYKKAQDLLNFYASTKGIEDLENAF